MTARGFFTALLLVAGSMLSGSDGDWFPWPNLAGMALLGCFVLATHLWIERDIDRAGDEDERPAPWRK